MDSAEFLIFMILTKFSFVPQTFISNLFIQGQDYDQDQSSNMKFNNKKLCSIY